jgi:hypothetical protein
VSALLPFRECTLVHSQDFTALDGSHLQLKPALFDLLADMPRIGRILTGFP